ncbi:thiosulfate oxidation carrier protein SoxY [Donghicola mangrovi]|uniref:Thiosulfate oxidation carrier protein SoxY n=1 Tax=Donghicola mangrovi TaxID=2729614 RepID=A0A850Q168_9RHOB|nr:thiosulfate oxidation carrier protein SoxY [Donghicola mangrovi]NVO22734.1 thiosulfate oxidation carrier protein SoxY [Donghicola mangrovi]
MQFTRRDTLALGAGAAALAMLPFRVAAATADERIAEFTGGAEAKADGITLTAPEIAENGNTVPITVDAPGATSILLLATGNPTPGVAQYNFGPLSGSRVVTTRIRLAGTQDVVALAKFEDGSIAKASSTVKVTIGGCGG